MFRKKPVLLILVLIGLMLSGCNVNVTLNTNSAKETAHSDAALSLKSALEGDPKLMALMEKSIAKAHEINPDPDTNPVDNVEELYDFIDWNVKGLPWNLLTNAEYPTMYNHIDQSIDYIWFLMDQPLDELKGKDITIPHFSIMNPSLHGGGNIMTTGVIFSLPRTVGMMNITKRLKMIRA